MKFSLSLVETSDKIISLILKELKDQAEKAINSCLPRIIEDIKVAVKEALISEPEYGSLKAGTLRAEFGIADVSSVDSVVDLMVNTITVQNNPITISSKGLNGGFILTMIKSDDISGVIYSDSANVTDNENGYSLPWLEWLLLKGNETIVQNYSVKYTNSQVSRSGMAVMVESSNSWRVPSNFVGDSDNNWTTRAINKINKDISTIISNNLNSAL